MLNNAVMHKSAGTFKSWVTTCEIMEAASG